MDKTLEKRIGKAARKARVALGMTQAEVAERIRVSVEFYSRIERGTASPSLKTLMAMAMLFETSTDHLLGLTEEDSVREFIKEHFPAPPEDRPELKLLFRKLRNSSPEIASVASSAANTVMNKMEKLARARSAAKKKTTRRTRRRKTQEDGDGSD